jgi:hypothetical protein
MPAGDTMRTHHVVVKVTVPDDVTIHDVITDVKFLLTGEISRVGLENLYTKVRVQSLSRAIATHKRKGTS